MMTYAPLLIALMLVGLPAASANVNLCWAPVGACVYSWSFDSGNGSCDEGAPDWYSYRTLRLSHDDGTTSRTTELRNDCDAHARPEGNTEGSSLRIHYTEHDREAKSYSYLWVDWVGRYSPASNTCRTDVWIHNFEHLPAGTTELGCPTGAPPFVLHVLP